MFDKKYDHLLCEKQAQELWAEKKLFLTPPSPTYRVDTPPPTVSGSLHIGHIFSYTQTDIIVRYKRLMGESVFYPMGFDDNGLPTERFVEKKNDIQAHTLSRTDFINLCLKETASVEEKFKLLWQKIGLSIDWDKTYSTISDSSRAVSQASFLQLYRDGFVYRKEDPALYCTACRTTVAQAELDDASKQTLFYDVAFTGPDNKKLIISTTRPELLYSCGALLYHPSDKRYQYLAGVQVQVPVYGHMVPVYADDMVDQEKGTGLVMCCTFGDKTDILWFKKHKLPLKLSLGHDGKWLPETGVLAGLRCVQAREKIVQLLTEQGVLLKQIPLTHSVNVHERCKREIEYLILPQWFLKIIDYKQDFLDLADQINWYPSFMKARYKNWVENISWDWCLSRQRFYGIPFPVWHCNECKELLLATNAQLPVDPRETSYQGTCTRCGSSDIRPDTDVMDTWNTSSLSPFICFDQVKKEEEISVFDAPDLKEFIPMSIRPQAHDIIRTWAFYTIVKSWFHTKTVPWRDIVISGHVLSGEKEKISKSRGNTPQDPDVLLQRYPADAIRYWTASGTLGHDMAFSETQLAIGQKLLIKLWNAFRFAEPYCEQFDGTKPEKLGSLNEWLLDKSSRCFDRYTTYFAQHEFSLALDSVEKFFWHDYCDTYIELVKDQLMNPDLYKPEEVQATRWTLYHVGLRLLQLYSPFVPHITETLFGLMYQKREGKDSLYCTRYNEYQQKYEYGESVAIIEDIIRLVGCVRKLKTEQQLSLKTELAELEIVCADKVREQKIREHEQLLKGATAAQKIMCVMSSEGEQKLVLEKIQDSYWRGRIS